MKRANILFLINVLSGIGFSIFLPLFPSIGIKNGLNDSFIGLIIGIFYLPNILISPFNPSALQNFKRIKLLYLATFGEAATILLYGFLSFININSFYQFLVLMIIARIMHGFCSRLIKTSVFSLTIFSSIPSEVQKKLSNVKKGWCIGLILGPILASIFNKGTKYHLSFLIIGVLLFVSFFLSTKVSNKIESNEEISGEMPLKFLFKKEIIFILGTFFFGYISKSYFYPCLVNNLEKIFNLSFNFSILFFLIIPISNEIVIRYLDLFISKFGFYGTSFIGLLIISLGILMIGPYSLFSKHILSVIIGLFLIGGGEAIISIPGLFLLTISIKDIDPNIDEQKLNEISSSIHFFITNIFEFLGPIIGGFLSTILGFKNCCLTISSFILLYCIFYYIHFHKYILEDFKRKKNIENKTKIN